MTAKTGSLLPPRRGAAEDLMKVITENIVNAKSAEDLLPLLGMLAEEIGTHADSRRMTADQLRSMTSYLTSIRLLLDRLKLQDSRSNGKSRRLAEEFVELEGLFKEMRNDLDRARRKNNE